jgi:LacI family transcriptional regulator
MHYNINIKIKRPAFMKKKRVTRKEIAELANVSPSTVSRALSGHPSIPKSTAEKILKIAEKLNYVPSYLAKSFYQKKSYRLGAVIPYCATKDKIETVPSEYFSQMLYGCIISASSQNYTISVISDDGLDEKELARYVLSHMVDGLILLGTKFNDRRFEYLLQEEIPFILVYNYIPDRDCLFVDIDCESGMREAFEYLIKKGVKSYGFLGGNKEFVDAIDREKTFLNLVKEFNINEFLLVEGDFSRESGFAAAPKFIEKGLPEAILCANDQMAFGLIRGFQKSGIKVPEDVKIVGFDNQEISLLSSPSITTINNPFYMVGKLAAKNLINFLNKKEIEIKKLKSTLIIRESA